MLEVCWSCQKSFVQVVALELRQFDMFVVVVKKKLKFAAAIF